MWSYRIPRQKTQKLGKGQKQCDKMQIKKPWRTILKMELNLQLLQVRKKATDLRIRQVSYRMKQKPGLLTLIPMSFAFAISLFLGKLYKMFSFPQYPQETLGTGSLKPDQGNEFVFRAACRGVRRPQGQKSKRANKRFRKHGSHPS